MLLAMRESFLFLFAVCLAFAAAPAGPVEFREHVIEANIPGGYSLLVTDINKDGNPEVIGLTQRSTVLSRNENPTWERHVVVKDMNGLVNMAASDNDGHGRPEIALGSALSMVAAKREGV